MSFSQDLSQDYFPEWEFSLPTELADTYEQRFLEAPSQVVVEKAAVKKTFKSICEEKSEYFSQLVEGSTLMHQDSLSIHVQSILDKLVASNPTLAAKEYRVFLYRSPDCNAFNIGEGLILLHIGLLERLETEDQIAFILSHELGHEHFNHVYNSMWEASRLRNDKGLKRQIKSTARQTYQAGHDLENLLLSMYAEKQLHNRNNEFVCDSIALQFMQNADFDLTAAIEVLEILKTSDEVYLSDTLDIALKLNSSTYRFKDEWLEDLGGEALWSRTENLFEIPDSIKSHPDCNERIDQLIQVVTDQRETTSSTTRLGEIAAFENVQLLLDREYYSLSLYYSLQLSKSYPNNIYLKCATAHSLLGIADALRNRRFSQSVDFEDPIFPNSYNALLKFLHNSSSSRLIKIYQGIYTDKLAPIKEHLYVDYLKLFAAQVQDEPLGAALKAYKTKYKNEHYNNLLEYFHDE